MSKGNGTVPKPGTGQKRRKIEAETEVVSTLSKYIWKIKNFRAICSEGSKMLDALASEEFSIRSIQGLESIWKIKLQPHCHCEDGTEMIRIFMALVRTDANLVLADFSVKLGNVDNPKAIHVKEWSQVASAYKNLENTRSTYLMVSRLHERNLLDDDTGIVLTVKVKLFEALNNKGWTQNLSLNVRQPETSFHSALSQDMASLFNDQKSSDVTVNCGNRTFYAHRVILSARSPVFKTMFSSGLSEATTGRLVLEDMDEDTAEAILSYIYTGEVRLPESESISYLDLIPVVEKYSLTELKSYCFEKLIEDVTQENILRIVETVDLFEASEEVKTMVKDFCRRHVDVLLEDPDFKANFFASLNIFGY